MRVIIGNNIRIEDPSDALKCWAKDHLILPNPEYAKRERMGYWLGRTPKNLRLYEYRGLEMVLPFGVLREIMPLIRGSEMYTDFHQDEAIDYGEDVPLYDYQQMAVDGMVAAKYGMLKAPCGSGKTQCGISIVKRFGRRALWLCHTADLLKQSKDRALMYMPEDLIGTITEGKVNIGKGITFATVQTMANLDLPLYRNEWDVVIVDEAHRCSGSVTTVTRYQKVLNNLAARHKIGLTATPERSDGLIKATYSLLGKIVWEVPKEAIADRTMKVKIIAVPTDLEITDECLNDDGTINYTNLIEHLSTDEERNKLIARKIVEEKGHSCLILSDRLAHLEAIINLLPDDMQEESAFINGKMQSKKAKKEREQAIDDMRTGKKKYLFSSLSLSREGLDIPRLDRLFLATPAKFSAVVTQAVGRIQRTFDGKEMPVAFDFVDVNVGYCTRAFRERKKSYRRVGAEIEVTFDEPYKNS